MNRHEQLATARAKGLAFDFSFLMYSTCVACKYSIGQREKKDETNSARSTTNATYNLPEGDGNVANVIIATYDGKVYTSPEDIKVERNESTEMFYQFLKRFRDEMTRKKEGTA